MELFLNTASSATEFFLSKNKELICHQSWAASNNEASTLLPQIRDCLQSRLFKPKDITEIIVVKGPGSFTGIRVGATIANMISAFTGAKLFELDLFTLLEEKLPAIHKQTPATILIKAGRNQVYLKQTGEGVEAVKTIPFNEKILDHSSQTIFGDLLPEQEQALQSWLQPTQKKWIPQASLKDSFEAITVLTTHTSLAQAALIKPLYIKSPTITKSKKCST